MIEVIEMSKKGKMGEYDEYECKEFANILLKAEEIKADPKKLAAAQKHLKAQKKAITSIEQIRQIANAPKEDEEYEESDGE